MTVFWKELFQLLGLVIFMGVGISALFVFDRSISGYLLLPLVAVIPAVIISLMELVEHWTNSHKLIAEIEKWLHSQQRS